MPYSEAQKNATARYKKKIGMVKINLDVTSATREKFKKQAEQKGKSLTAYITDLIEKDMEEHK